MSNAELDSSLSSNYQDYNSFQPSLDPTTVVDAKAKVDAHVTSAGGDTITRSDGSQVKLDVVPGQPDIPVPLGLSKLGTKQDLSVNLNDDPNSAPNPFFFPSFAAALARVSVLLQDLYQKSAFMEAQIGIKNYQKTMEITKQNRDLTLASYNNQAQEKMFEAVNSFVNAAVSGLSALQTMGIAGRANQRATADVETSIKQEQKSLETLKAQKNGGTVVSGSSTQTFTAPTDPNQIAQLNKEIAAKEKVVNNLVANRDQNIKAREDVYRREFNEYVHQRTDIFNRISDGIFKTLESGLIKERGQLEATKQMNEGYLNILRTFSDNTNNYQHKAQDAFDKITDLFTKIIDSNYRAFSMRG